MARLQLKRSALFLLGVLALVYGYLLFEHVCHFPREKLLAAMYDKTLGVIYLPLLGLFQNTLLTISFWCVVGPLKYVLVTPQSHRVHHSLDAEHRDTNFGSVFSIWDFALGTQCKSFELYPDTGIEDKDFPYEQRVGLKSLILTPLYQLLYPLSNIGRARDSSGEANQPGEQ